MSEHFDTVIISDIHLGNRACQHDRLIRFLEQLDCSRLIINGDLFDSTKVGYLTPNDARVLLALAHLSRKTCIDYIQGNHDPQGLLNYDKVGLNCRVKVGDHWYLVMHGDAFDTSMTIPPGLINVIQWVFRALQWVPKAKKIVDWMTAFSENNSLQQHIMDQSVQFARRMTGFGSLKIDGVILGHTHDPFDGQVDGMHVLNCGSWVEEDCTYVGIKIGLNILEVKLHHWEDPK